MSKKTMYDLAIIGGGAGGLSLASGAAQLGLDVVLFEGHKMGGDCLNYGCVPSKALLAAAKSIYNAKHKAPSFGAKIEVKSLDFKKVMAHVHGVIKSIEPHDSPKRFKSLGVKVIQSQAKFIDKHTIAAGKQKIKAKKIVIATGSSPFIPPIDNIENTEFLTNESIFELKALPKQLIVVGGGPIGCELAQAFCMLGSKVTIIEAFSILPKDDNDCVAIVKDSLKSMGIDILEDTKVNGVAQKSKTAVEVKVSNAKGNKTIKGTHLLVATGRKANIAKLDLDKAKIEHTPRGVNVNAKLQTNHKHIFAIGDVASPYQFTHMASYQAGVVLRQVVFKLPSKASFAAVPWVTYTYPELAHVGKTSEDAQNHPELEVTEWPFGESDRARAEAETEGKIKVITDKKGKIEGVTIVGSHAGELILPWVMALREGKGLRAFTDTIAPYPTLSEISKFVSGEFYKPRLFTDKVRKIVSWLKRI